jgi:predicted DNA-binding protein
MNNTTRTITFRLPLTLYQQLQKVADQRRSQYAAPNLSELVRQAIEEFVEDKNR